MYPFDSVITLTLNGSVPGAVLAILMAIPFGRTVLRTRSFWVGAVLIAGAALGAMWYGHYFAGSIGNSLGEWVWWL